MVIFICTGLVSAGAITITNTTQLSIGNASTNGSITYAENAAACPPELPAMPAMPSMPSMPSIGVISGVSTGAEDFVAIDVPPQELAGGTYNYRNYTVKNATVSYNGSVTILTKGDVLIENGTVNTTTSSITFISGRDILIGNGGTLSTADSPAGTSGGITFEAAGSVDLENCIVSSGKGTTSGGVLIKAFGINSITLSNSLINTGQAEVNSGDVELWSGGSIDANNSLIQSGSSNGTSGHVALYAQGKNSITLNNPIIETGDAEAASGDVELWSAGSIADKNSILQSGGSANGTSGHLAAYALGGSYTSTNSVVGTKNAAGDSGYLELLAAGPVTCANSVWQTGDTNSSDSGDITSTSVNAHTSFVNAIIATGTADSGKSGSILIQDFAPRPEGGVISVDNSVFETGDAGVSSGDITFLTGFNPCEAEVPVLTPVGALALISLLAAIAAVTIVRKRH